jgi:hypothetical protein
VKGVAGFVMGVSVGDCALRRQQWRKRCKENVKTRYFKVNKFICGHFLNK